jgi:hypothetical protein
LVKEPDPQPVITYHGDRGILKAYQKMAPGLSLLRSTFMQVISRPVAAVALNTANNMTNGIDEILRQAQNDNLCDMKVLK